MLDVFISYAHEDQAFARLISQGLEAEGFSVWLDHTIPPGKTWDSHIAAGIEAAKACVVLWSVNSVGSDWVKEEATLARDAGKYLPVALDDSQPPVGFRRIQAAQMAGWGGDRANAQFRLLVGETRALVEGKRTAPAPAPMGYAQNPAAPPPVQDVPAAPPPPPEPVAMPASFSTPPAPAAPPPPPAYTPPASVYEAPAAPAYTPAEPARTGPPILLRAVIAVAVLGAVGVGGYILTRGGGGPAPGTDMADTAPPPAPATEPAMDPAEIERLRQERDAAVQQAADAEAQRVESERAAQEAAEAAAQAQRQRERQQQQQQQQVASAVGRWVGSYTYDDGVGGDATIDFLSDGTFLVGGQYAGSWNQSGASISFTFQNGTRFDGRVRNNRLSGSMVGHDGVRGTFSVDRY